MMTLRSLLVLAWIFFLSVVMFIGGLPLLLLPRRWCVAAARLWARLVLWGLAVFGGIGLTIRGRLPEGGVLVAAKHFSMWETVALTALLKDPAIVLKQELLRIPLYGAYAKKQKMIAIDRAAGAKALRSMHRQSREALDAARPIVIFPEGTRKDIGAPADYKPGVAGLYAALNVACVPVAHDSGLFWKGGMVKRTGAITLEILEILPPGIDRRTFMTLLEERIETTTARLIAASV